MKAIVTSCRTGSWLLCQTLGNSAPFYEHYNNTLAGNKVLLRDKFGGDVSAYADAVRAGGGWKIIPSDLHLCGEFYNVPFDELFSEATHLVVSWRRDLFNAAYSMAKCQLTGNWRHVEGDPHLADPVYDFARYRRLIGDQKRNWEQYRGAGLSECPNIIPCAFEDLAADVEGVSKRILEALHDPESGDAVPEVGETVTSRTPQTGQRERHRERFLTELEQVSGGLSTEEDLWMEDCPL